MNENATDREIQPDFETGGRVPVTGFTPGPWHVEEDDDGIYVIMDVLDHARDEALTVYAANSAAPEIRRADARLIAESPILFALLTREYLSWVPEDDTRSADHLYYHCDRCAAEALDDPWVIEHEADCENGEIAAAIARVRGS